VLSEIICNLRVGGRLLIPSWITGISLIIIKIMVQTTLTMRENILKDLEVKVIIKMISRDTIMIMIIILIGIVTISILMK